MSTAADIVRREAIAEYALIGAPPEPDLQGLVDLAATVCGVPTAVINIIDDRAQHQIAAIGFEPSVCSREDSMCNAVFQEPGHVVVPDAREDARFRDNPFVTGDIASIRFYASSPLITPKGVPIGTLCVFDDVVGDLSEQRSRSLALLAHQVVDVLELRRMTRELSRSNAQLAEFAGQVSHDLRNPLTALRGFLELAADSPELADAPTASGALARAEGAAERMSAMVEDLLDYARVGGSLRRSRVDLGAVVADALDDLDASVAAAGAVVEVEPLPHVTGDATLLRALMQNLLANAVKFAGAERGRPRVSVRAHDVGSSWRIAVDDDGPGIPPHERERVFGLLARGGSGDVEGSGIGLSTCRRIVEAHGGSIGIDDAAAGGASVWVLLPADG
ncbi:sensor histidine kinase [Agrococcus carbonis]|uniref:Sensor-like histidine kinase SenX3 n=1 Tax=Agrococcus carbonis TaxID=684552 RepID=A0A1H1LUN9_9MICO|nr:GAF domain-containing sensor histidine kinase [Agrococcus carbonis]SDR78246.1 His Kinase A (phospho-acceptor) domain-containing protein [Agrococcus carbonis]